MKKKNTVILIGLGAIGLNYDIDSKNDDILTHAKSLINHSEFEFIGAVDNSLKQRNIFKKKYKIPVFTNIKEAFIKHRHRPDMVVISVPTKNHYKIINSVINIYNPDVILCEKPFCNNYSEALKISKICKQKKIKLYVNYVRHCLPGVKLIKSLINKGSIKTPLKGSIWFSRGFFNNGSHFIELLNYWIGPIKKVSLIHGNCTNYYNDKIKDFRIEFKNGLINFLENPHDNYSHQSIELLSKNNRIIWDHQENLYLQNLIINKRYPQYKIIDKKLKKIDLKSNKIQFHVYNEISKMFKKKKFEICNYDDALKVSKILFKIKKLSKLNLKKYF